MAPCPAMSADGAPSHPVAEAWGVVTMARLLLLAAVCFLSVTGELFPVGALPQIASSLQVSDAAVGTLLGVYAVIAGASAIPFTAVVRRWPRRRVLMVATGVLGLSLLASAIAPNFAVLAAARGLAALMHGVLWSTVAPVAASLSPTGSEGRATAVVFAGNSIALIAGAPLSALAAQTLGWRETMVVMGLAGLAMTVVLGGFLPAMAAPGQTGPVAATGSDAGRQGRQRGRGIGNLAVLTALIVAAHFLAYSFIAVVAERALGIDGRGLVILLAGYGVAGAVGTIAGGMRSDTAPDRTLRATLATMVLGLLALTATVAVPAGQWTAVLGSASVLVWGAAYGAVPTQLQTGVLRIAPDRQDAASSVYVTCFQIGIAAGSVLGGLLLGSTGTAVLCASAAVVAFAGLVLAATGRVTVGRTDAATSACV